ncbi:MAG: hypothetical protein GF421_10135 [Candidatus Aminicenantes bacterium]|nr:hypothetical protein [Candidatus Aminicenantes bacterium]
MKKILTFITFVSLAAFFLISCSSRAREEETYEIKAIGVGNVIFHQAQACINQSKAYRTAWEYAKVTGMDFKSAADEILGQDMKDNKQMMLENKAQIEGMLQELKKPPDKYSEAHKKLKELYEIYLKLHNLAIEPLNDMEKHDASVNDLAAQTMKKKEELDNIYDYQ